jgi:hypothetical protein
VPALAAAVLRKFLLVRRSLFFSAFIIGSPSGSLLSQSGCYTAYCACIPMK